MRYDVAITFAVVTMIGGGCLVGPNYHAPKTANAPAFGELNDTASTNQPVAEWWHEFHDMELDKLVSEALRDNFDLQIAAMRVRESRFQRNVVAADLFPEVDADGSYVHSRGSKNVVLPFGGGSSQSGSAQTAPTKLTSSSQADTPQSPQTQSSASASPASASQPNPFGKGGLPGTTTDLYQVGFDASWEIDVFGGQRRRVEAANADSQAATEGRRDLEVTVAAEMVRDYLELRGNQARFEIARANLAAQDEFLRLTRSKRSVGLVTDTEVIRAASQRAVTAAMLSPLEARSHQLIHSLSTMAAKNPNELMAELSAPQPLPQVPPQIPVGLPSELIKRRPDIRQAERQIAAANARIGVAQADLFPKFEMIGSAGLDSSSAANLFDWESRYFLISPTVTWRIFDAGRVLGNIKLQRSNEQEAVLQYRNTILKAFKEVEDALVNYATEQNRRNHLANALRQNRDALDLAQKRYADGLADFLTVIEAEQNVFSAQDAYTQSNQASSTDIVAVYKSLGGGWK